MDDLEQNLQIGSDSFDEGEGRPRWVPPSRKFDEVAREIEEIRREHGNSGCTLVFEFIPTAEDLDSTLRKIYPGPTSGKMYAWFIPHQGMLPKTPGSGNQYTVIRNVDGDEHFIDDSIRIYYFQPDQPLLES